MNVTRRNQEGRVRKLGGDIQCSILKLEAVVKHHVIALGGVVAERTFEGRGIVVQFDIADVSTQLFFDTLERVVSNAVPALFRNAAGHQKPHLECVLGESLASRQAPDQSSHACQAVPSCDLHDALHFCFIMSSGRGWCLFRPGFDIP